MGTQELLLFAAKRPDQIRPFDAPAAQGLPCCLVLPDQLPTAIEADPVPIKQFVHMGESSRPLAPISRSLLSQDRQGLMWLATRNCCRARPVNRQAGSRSATRWRNNPCPNRALVSPRSVLRDFNEELLRMLANAR